MAGKELPIGHASGKLSRMCLDKADASRHLPRGGLLLGGRVEDVLAVRRNGAEHLLVWQ
jgi:hypothetical protein